MTPTGRKVLDLSASIHEALDGVYLPDEEYLAILKALASLRGEVLDGLLNPGEGEVQT